MALIGWPDDINDDGSGQTGTVHNQAFSDAQEAAIEGYIIDPGNPSVLVRDIIAEVIEARSGEDTLDIRIDSIEAQIGVGQVTQAQVQTIIGGRNVAENGDLEDWSAGAAAAPDNWTLQGAAATIARTGSGEADTFTFGTTKYAAKVTRSGADADLYQDVVQAAEFADFINVRGQKISVACKVKASLASQARIQVTDGITTTNSSFHTGNGVEQHLTVTHTISGSATQLRVLLQVVTTNGAVHFGGVQIVFAEFAPSDWQARSQESKNRDPVSFKVTPKYRPGLSADPIASVSGLVNVGSTAVGNIGVGEDTLMSYTLPANVLSANGRGLRITFWGVCANNANNKRIKLFFGASNIMDTGAGNTYQNEFFQGQAYVLRSAVDTQFGTCQFLAGPAAASLTAADSWVTQFGPGGEDDGAAIIIKVTGEATADDDIVQYGLVVETLG